MYTSIGNQFYYKKEYYTTVTTLSMIIYNYHLLYYSWFVNTLVLENTVIQNM